MISSHRERLLAQYRAGTFVVLSLILLGFIDNIEGTELRLYPLYLVPLGVAGARLPFVYAMLSAALATYVWGLSNFFAGMELSNRWYWVFNLISQLLGFSVFVLLIARLRGQADAQRALARTDVLTGLPNSRGFHEAAATELERQKRFGGSLCAAYLDLDDFKQINEILGHQGADELLLAIGSAMRSATRRIDIVARMGGDEFALLLPHSGEEEARVVLGRLRERVGEAAVEHLVGVTFSMGAMVFLEPPESVDALLRQTDALMYEVKRAGKNSIVVRGAESASS